MAERPTQGAKLFYLEGTPQAGLPGTSALSELANPPQSALDAEQWSKERAQATGHTGSTTAEEYKALSYQNRDPIRDLAIHQSIVHDTGDED